MMKSYYVQITDCTTMKKNEKKNTVKVLTEINVSLTTLISLRSQHLYDMHLSSITK